MTNLLDLYVLTVREPRLAAQSILRLHLSPASSVAALVVAMIVGVLISTFIQSLVGQTDPAAAAAAGIEFTRLSPLGTFGVTMGAASVMVAVIWLIGYAFGGTGGIFPIMALMAWAELFNSTLQALAVLVGLIVPLAGAVLVLAVVVLVLRALVNFVQEAHGFESFGKAVAVFICALLLGAFILSNLAIFTGFVRVVEVV